MWEALIAEMRAPEIAGHMCLDDVTDGHAPAAARYRRLRLSRRAQIHRCLVRLGIAQP